MVCDDLLTLYQMVSQAHLRRLHMDMLRRLMWFEVQYNVVTAAQMRMSEALLAQLIPYWQGEPLPKAQLLKKQWDLPKNQRTRFIAQVGEYEYQSWLCTIPELNIKWAKTKGPPFLNHHDHHEWDDLLDWQHAVVHVSNRKDPHLFTMLEQAP